MALFVRSRTIVTAALCCGLLLPACRPGLKTPPTPPPSEVTVLKPVLYPVQTYLEYSGNLDAIETVELKARVRGVLTDVDFADGAEVKKDQVLFRIDPLENKVAEKKAVADKLKAMADLKRSQSEENRAKRLLGSRSISEEEYLQRVAARETAEAEVKQAEADIETAQLQIGYAQIKAPITGRIGRAAVTKGNLVGQNETTLLGTIVSHDPIDVYFDVPEKDLIQYFGTKERKASKAPVEVGVANEVGFPHQGEIDFLDNRIDPGSGTVRMRGQLPNAKKADGARSLFPGLYARVRIPIGARKSMLAVPEEAVMAGQEGRFVFVVNDKSVVQKRTVVLGPIIWRAPPPGSDSKITWSTTLNSAKEETRFQSVVSVAKGLSADDVVVAVGLQKARPGGNVKPDLVTLVPPPTDSLPPTN